MFDPFSLSTTFKFGRRLRRLSGLSFEEAFLGSATEEFVDSSFLGRRIFFLPFLILLASTVLFGRLWWLQVQKGEEFALLAENNRVRQWVNLAPRGLITDRNGEVLADNTVRFRLLLLPAELPAEKRVGIVETLSGLLSLPKEPLLEILLENSSVGMLTPIELIADLDATQRAIVATNTEQLPGLLVDGVTLRRYANPFEFSHVLGYTGALESKDLDALLKQGYSRQDAVGKIGVEAQYEKFLKGKNGASQLEVDAQSRLVRNLGNIESEIGQTVELNIDAELQRLLYSALGAQGGRAAAVAIEPTTGAVLALVSLPGFDTNKLTFGLTVQQRELLFSDSAKPFFNRAISGTYPPGSTIKPVVAAAALQAGTITPKTIITDRGFLSIPHRYDAETIYNFYGWKRDGLGPMDVYSAIARSSDIYFYTVVGGHPNSPVQALGVERLAEFFRKFGLGSKTGIDLNAEAAGLVPDPAWKAQRFSDPELARWYLGDTYHMSIGQGDVLATPLQAALWTATIANNGIGMRPRILKRVSDHSGRTVYELSPEILISPGIDALHMQTIKQAMRQTVTDGSAKMLADLPIKVAGKTGTSEFDDSDPSKTHAWFVSFAPYENPKIALAVIVEAGGEGHAAAVPVAKKVLQWWANNRMKN